MDESRGSATYIHRWPHLHSTIVVCRYSATSPKSRTTAATVKHTKFNVNNKLKLFFLMTKQKVMNKSLINRPDTSKRLLHKQTVMVHHLIIYSAEKLNGMTWTALWRDNLPGFRMTNISFILNQYFEFINNLRSNIMMHQTVQTELVS